MIQIPLEHMAPLTHPSADLFLLGFTAGCSLVAGMFFLRFWRKTRDPLFLGFAAFFLMQGGIDALLLGFAHPNTASSWLFLLRLFSAIVVLTAILQKNTGRRGPRRESEPR